jgi:hypothetical protein
MNALPHKRSASSVLYRPGLISLLLASVALVMASIPYLRVLALPLSGLGVILCGIVMMSANNRKSGLPLAGGVASLAVFLLTGLWLGQFEFILGRWRKSPASEQKTVSLQSQAARSETGHSPNDWVDASQDAVQFGDVRVRLVSATCGTVELKDAKGKRRPSEKCLVLKVRVSNAGAARVMQFHSWYEPGSPSEKGVPLLHDDHGKLYPLKVFPADMEVVGLVAQATLPPSKKVEDVIVFEGRPALVEFLRLELPASAFGSSGSVRLQIPGRMIQGR